jgi:hypothetical protein
MQVASAVAFHLLVGRKRVRLLVEHKLEVLLR